MRPFLLAFLLVVSLALVTSHSLCTPDKWEGDQSTTTAYANANERGKYEEYMRVSYDATTYRSSVFVQTLIDGKWSFHQILMIFNETVGHRYTKNLLTDNCTVQELPPPFPLRCIPGNFYLGLEGVYNVSSYYAFGPMLTSNVIVAHEKDNVVPVMETISGRIEGYDVLRIFTFKDITPGIKNENVFDIPEECSEDDAWLENAKHLSREHSFIAL